MKHKSTSTIIGASLGNGLEIYDFTVYSFFSVIIADQFFQVTDSFSSIFISVSVFGVGFIMRPIGSIILGAYCDIYGRKSALLLTIVLMGVGTFLLAFTPTYNQIGIIAPIIIILARLIQGFAAGGEFGAATTLLLESSTKGRQSFYVSWQPISQGISALFGASLALILSYCLTKEQLYTWGWRIPFIIGLLIIPIGIYIRKNINETLVKKIEINPFKILFNNYLKVFILGILIIISGSALVYIALLYMPTYMIKIANFTPSKSYFFSCISAIIQIIGVAISAIYMDKRNNYKQVFCISILVSLICIYPVFYFLIHEKILWISIIFQCTLIFSLGINMLSSTMLIITSLSEEVRGTGIAMIYAFAVTLCGGTSQPIVQWLIETTGDPLSPVWYLSTILAISLISALLFRNGSKYVNINTRDS
ncbi:MAG: MFS transporter [Providencia sp.]|jgi:MFS family permease|nr:MFS transporter [Providencia sp.]